MASEAVLNLLINLAGDAAERARGLGEQIGGLGPIAVSAGLAVGGALLAGLGKGFDLATEARDGVNQLEAQLGLTRDEAEQLGDVGVEVFGGNWYSSIEEATAAVGTMKQTLGGVADVSEEELKGAAESAAALKDVFGVEVPEAADAAATLMDEFGLSSDQAFDFLAKGFQSGLDRSGDFLDTIGEYSVQFSEAGHDAGDFFSILETGSAGGVLGTDKIADAFKESRIRIAENTDEIIEAYKSIGATFEDNITTTFKRGGDNRAWADEVIGEFQRVGVDAEQYRKQLESGAMSVEAAFGNSLAAGIADGSVSIADAQKLIIDGLGEMDNGVQRNAAGVAIFGTQWEDAGAKAILGVDTAKTSLDDLNGATDSLNAKYNSFGSLFGGAWRMIQTEVLLPVGETLLSLANEAMPLVQAGVSGLGDAITFVKDNAGQFTPILIGLGVGLGVYALAQGVASVAAWGGVAALGSLIATAAIAAAPFIALGVVAAGLYLAWQSNFGGIRDVTAEVWAFIVAATQPAIAELSRFWNEVQPQLMAAWENIKAVTLAVGSAILSFIQENQATILSVISGAWQMIQGVVQIGWSLISGIISVGLAVLSGDWSGAWTTIQQTVQGVWGGIQTFLSGAWVVVQGIFDLGLAAVTSAVSTGFAYLRDTSVGQAINGIVTIVRGLWNGELSITTLFYRGLENLQGQAEVQLEWLRGMIFDSKLGAVFTTAQGYVNQIKGLFTSGWDAVKSTVSTTWSAISGYISGPIETAQGIVDRVIGQIKGVVQGGLDLVNNFIDAVNSIPGVPDLPNIPGRAMGGPVLAGSPYIVGERGPELIVPQRNGYVYTADQTRGLLSGSAAPVTNNYYTVNATYSRAQDERTIGDDLRRLTLMGSVS